MVHQLSKKEKQDVRTLLKPQEETYWGDRWRVGERISAGENLDWSIGRGVIVEIDKKNPEWAKVKLDKTGEIVRAWKFGSYKLTERGK